MSHEITCFTAVFSRFLPIFCSACGSPASRKSREEEGLQEESRRFQWEGQFPFFYTATHKHLIWFDNEHLNITLYIF